MAGEPVNCEATLDSHNNKGEKPTGETMPGTSENEAIETRDAKKARNRRKLDQIKEA